MLCVLTVYSLLWLKFHCMHISQLVIHSPGDEDLSSFQFGDIANKAFTNMHA